VIVDEWGAVVLFRCLFFNPLHHHTQTLGTGGQRDDAAERWNRLHFARRDLSGMTLEFSIAIQKKCHGQLRAAGEGFERTVFGARRIDSYYPGGTAYRRYATIREASAAHGVSAPNLRYDRSRESHIRIGG